MKRWPASSRVAESGSRSFPGTDWLPAHPGPAGRPGRAIQPGNGQSTPGRPPGRPPGGTGGSGLMCAEDLQRAIDLPAVRGERLPRGRALSRGELRALFESCRSGEPSDLRDAALIGVLYAAGLRRAEVVSLDVSDYDPETGALIVRGKGNKERNAYIDDGAAEAMGEWLRVRGDELGPLFCPITQIGEITIRADDRPGHLLHSPDPCEESESKPFSPHDLRRSCVSDLLDAGVDISIVQQFVGHANVNTTARYDRRGEHAKKRAAKSLHVPFVIDSASERV